MNEETCDCRSQFRILYNVIGTFVSILVKYKYIYAFAITYMIDKIVISQFYTNI